MQLASHPRFRTDLVAECIETDGQRFIDVIDPDTGDAFRFYEVEYSIACAMDGERDLAGLVQWAREELGIEPSQAELATVISTLGHLGYLDAEAAGQAAAEVAAARTGDDDYDLQRGVVTRRVEPLAPVGGVELGQAGYEAAPPPDEVRGDDLELGVAGGQHLGRPRPAPPDDDLELGAPGAMEPTATLRRGKTRPDIDDDGPTNLPMPAADVGFDDDEVSVDLSQHLGDLGREEVRDAVRMSRSMRAVEVPPELLEQLGEQEAAIAARAEAAKQEALTQRALLDRPAGALSTDAEEPPPPPQEVPIIPRLQPKADPVVLPVKPVVVTKRSERTTVPPETKKATENPIKVNEPTGGGVSTILVVFLVLALLGAGAFFVWKYVLNDKKADDSGDTAVTKGTGAGTAKGTAKGTGVGTGTAKGTGTQVGTGTGTGSDVVVAPLPTAKLEATPGTPIDISGGPGGVVAWVVANDATIQAGDPVVQYQGAQLYKTKLGDSKSGLIWDIEVRVPGQIDKSTKQRDKAAANGVKSEVKRLDAYIKDRSERLVEKKEEAAKLQAKIDSFTIKSTQGGVVHPKTTTGKRVAKDAVVAQLDGAPTASATFEVPAEADKVSGIYKVDDAVNVAPKASPDKKTSCKVGKVEGTKVTVTCPASIGAAGADVVLVP